MQLMRAAPVQPPDRPLPAHRIKAAERKCPAGAVREIQHVVFRISAAAQYRPGFGSSAKNLPLSAAFQPCLQPTVRYSSAAKDETEAALPAAARRQGCHLLHSVLLCGEAGHLAASCWQPAPETVPRSHILRRSLTCRHAPLAPPGSAISRRSPAPDRRGPLQWVNRLAQMASPVY